MKEPKKEQLLIIDYDAFTFAQRVNVYLKEGYMVIHETMKIHNSPSKGKTEPNKDIFTVVLEKDKDSDKTIGFSTAK